LPEHEKVCLIVPCYNESKRLDIQSFKNFSSEKLFFLFVDDGSSDNTTDFLNKSLKGQLHMTSLSLKKNLGKANAIQQGYNFLKSTKTISQYTWIGYWDADLATPLWEIENMLKYANLFYPQCECIYASRVYRLGGKIIRSPLRHYLGRAFATLIYLALKVDSYDSQCGAKLIHQNVVDISFQKPFLSKWIFDVEIMLRLKKKEIVEYPLKYWKDIPGSKVKVGREIFRVLKDIIKIKNEYSKS
jgi:dolichyl-phosphate beta-glucosyltransferase